VVMAFNTSSGSVFMNVALRYQRQPAAQRSAVG
jgi:hypothetical protein